MWIQWFGKSSVLNFSFKQSREISTSLVCNWIAPTTRLRVVDNSALGREAAMYPKPVRCIQVYNKKQRGQTGDMVLVAIRGQKKKAWVVGSCLKPSVGKPRFDSNNIVLVNDDFSPLGTRVLAPIPSHLRGKQGEFSKIIAIASKFV